MWSSRQANPLCRQEQNRLPRMLRSDGEVKLIVETEIELRLPKSIITLLTETAKVCNVDIWVTTPREEIDELEEKGYGSGV